MKNIFLVIMTFLSTNIFAQEIWFVSPEQGSSQKGSITIQINPPYGNPPTVRAWISEEDGRERMLWSGKLNASENYTTTVDISKFPRGRYSLDVEYYYQREDFDGDINFWID